MIKFARPAPDRSVTGINIKNFSWIRSFSTYLMQRLACSIFDISAIIAAKHEKV